MEKDSETFKQRWTSKECFCPGSAQDEETRDEEFLLLLYARVLDDLDEFLHDVGIEAAVRKKVQRDRQAQGAADDKKGLELHLGPSRGKAPGGRCDSVQFAMRIAHTRLARIAPASRPRS